MNKATRTIAAITILLSLSLNAYTQDPTRVAPKAYKLQFENEWVKVTRVHYDAGEKIPVHDHTETGAAYVYLNDCGPVVFRHINAKYAEVTRPETKAGSFRLFRAVKESHEVENPNETPSDFLRVEFKTVEDQKSPLRGKYHREEYRAGQDFTKVQFENDQIRATRIACARTCKLGALAMEPSIVVMLTEARLVSSGSVMAGATTWLANGKVDEVSSTGPGHVELIRFDLKSKPK